MSAGWAALAVGFFCYCGLWHVLDRIANALEAEAKARELEALNPRPAGQVVHFPPPGGRG